ncbi:hypothetical protein [uncultured Jatrophihabitans sp.]|uniref:hypothetical protein n=1 Tax=uncultured Jatrophihabitans sp. TaxID=1610747 RepID=UPI0035CA2C15
MRHHSAPRSAVRRRATIGLIAAAIVISGLALPSAADADTPSTVTVTTDCPDLTATVEISGVSSHPSSLRNGHAVGDGNPNNPKGSPASDTGSDGSYDYTVTDVPITAGQTTMTGYIQGPVVSDPHENVGDGSFTACQTTPPTGQATATISCTPNDDVVITVSGSGMTPGSTVGTAVIEAGNTAYRDNNDGTVDTNGDYTGNPITTPDSLGFATVQVNGPSPSYDVKATGSSNIPDCDDQPPGQPDDSTLFADGPDTAAYGTRTEVLGVLTDSRTGEKLSDDRINLYARAGHSAPFAKLVTLSTNSNGFAEYDPRMTRTTAYYWTYAGDSSHRSATSNTMTVTVAPVFTLAKANHNRIRAKHAVRFYGTLNPARKGQTVYLQRYSHGHWHRTTSHGVIKKQRLPNGTRTYGFIISRKLAKHGKYRFRLSVKATQTLTAAHSRTIRVTVRKRRHH